jgi:transcriptional regulator with XRE-family HTH domain
MFGDILRSSRESESLSIRELAKFLDISYSALGKYERNEREPDIETIKKIADFFSVSLDYLLGRDTPLALNQRKLQLSNQIIKLLIEKKIMDNETELTDEKIAWLKSILEKSIDLAGIRIDK